MEKITAYKRAGKFGDEYLIPLKCLELLRKKETEKAYCCGEYTGYTYKDGNPQIHIFGYVPKSMLVKVGEEFFVPTWIIDKWNYTHLQFTKCRFCHERNNEYKCELNCFVDGVCHYAMQDTINPKFGEEPTYCDSYEEKEE